VHLTCHSSIISLDVIFTASFEYGRPTARFSFIIKVPKSTTRSTHGTILNVATEFPHALVIGSDQVALHGDDIVGKPGSHENAVAQLQQASGKCIELFTGLALVNAKTGRTHSLVESFKVHFRQLTLEQIENYLRKEQPYQCAGSVKSEGLGVSIIQRFEGDDPASLIGLPLIRLVALLERENFDVLAR